MIINWKYARTNGFKSCQLNRRTRTDPLRSFWIFMRELERSARRIPYQAAGKCGKWCNSEKESERKWEKYETNMIFGYSLRESFEFLVDAESKVRWIFDGTCREQTVELSLFKFCTLTAVSYKVGEYDVCLLCNVNCTTVTSEWVKYDLLYTPL